MYPGADRVDRHSTGISCCNLDIMLRSSRYHSTSIALRFRLLLCILNVCITHPI